MIMIKNIFLIFCYSNLKYNNTNDTRKLQSLENFSNLRFIIKIR